MPKASPGRKSSLPCQLLLPGECLRKMLSPSDMYAVTQPCDKEPELLGFSPFARFADSVVSKTQSDSMILGLLMRHMYLAFHPVSDRELLGLLK